MENQKLVKEATVLPNGMVKVREFFAAPDYAIKSDMTEDEIEKMQSDFDSGGEVKLPERFLKPVQGTQGNQGNRDTQ